jgi:hypothetical protein
MTAATTSLGLINNPHVYTTLNIIKEGVRKMKFIVLKLKKANGKLEITAEIQGYMADIDKFLPWLNI